MTIEIRNKESAINKCEELAALVDRYIDGKGNGAHATAIASGVHDAIDKAPRTFEEFARDYTPEFS